MTSLLTEAFNLRVQAVRSQRSRIWNDSNVSFNDVVQAMLKLLVKLFLCQ